MKSLHLETPRLNLKPFELDAAQHILDLDSDEEVVRYVGGPSCSDLESAREILQDIILPQYEKYGLGRLAVYLKETGAFIGWCGVKFKEEESEYDLGYRFFRGYWGKGYATESAKAALEFGHKVCKLKRIVGTADVLNTGSVHVLEKLGMKFEKFDFAHGGKIAVYASER